MAHTPGPWTPVECDGDADDLAIADSDGGHVCYYVATHADAMLIAAAPAMLDALRDAHSALCDMDTRGVSGGRGWREMDATAVDQLIAGALLHTARAIALAEGREL